MPKKCSEPHQDLPFLYARIHCRVSSRFPAMPVPWVRGLGTGADSFHPHIRCIRCRAFPSQNWLATEMQSNNMCSVIYEMGSPQECNFHSWLSIEMGHQRTESCPGNHGLWFSVWQRRFARNRTGELAIDTAGSKPFLGLRLRVSTPTNSMACGCIFGLWVAAFKHLAPDTPDKRGCQQVFFQWG